MKSLIRTYTVESFLYKDLNDTCRNKITSNIQLFGPYASALSLIINCGNKINKKELTFGGDQYAYRGMVIKKYDFE